MAKEHEAELQLEEEKLPWVETLPDEKDGWDDLESPSIPLTVTVRWHRVEVDWE